MILWLARHAADSAVLQFWGAVLGATITALGGVLVGILAIVNTRRTGRVGTVAERIEQTLLGHGKTLASQGELLAGMAGQQVAMERRVDNVEEAARELGETTRELAEVVQQVVEVQVACRTCPRVPVVPVAGS